MKDLEARAERIQYTMATLGWSDIAAILKDMESEAQEQIFDTMVRKPEALTGRKALIAAGGLRAIRDFKEALSDAVKPCLPNPSDKDGR